MSDTVRKMAIESIAQKIYEHESHKKRYGAFPSALDRAERILELPAVREYFIESIVGLNTQNLEKIARQEIIATRELT